MNEEQYEALLNELARAFYAAHGYQVEEGYDFSAATHPQERGMYNLAATAYELLADKGALKDEFLY